MYVGREWSVRFGFWRGEASWSELVGCEFKELEGVADEVEDVAADKSVLLESAVVV